MSDLWQEYLPHFRVELYEEGFFTLNPNTGDYGFQEEKDEECEDNDILREDVEEGSGRGNYQEVNQEAVIYVNTVKEEEQKEQKEGIEWESKNHNGFQEEEEEECEDDNILREDVEEGNGEGNYQEVNQEAVLDHSYVNSEKDEVEEEQEELEDCESASFMILKVHYSLFRGDNPENTEKEPTAHEGGYVQKIATYNLVYVYYI